MVCSGLPYSNRIQHRDSLKEGNLAERLIGTDKCINTALTVEIDGYAKLQGIQRSEAARCPMAGDRVASASR